VFVVVAHNSPKEKRSQEPCGGRSWRQYRSEEKEGKRGLPCASIFGKERDMRALPEGKEGENTSGLAFSGLSLEGKKKLHCEHFAPQYAEKKKDGASLRRASQEERRRQSCGRGEKELASSATRGEKNSARAMRISLKQKEKKGEERSKAVFLTVAEIEERKNNRSCCGKKKKESRGRLTDSRRSEEKKKGEKTGGLQAQVGKGKKESRKTPAIRRQMVGIEEGGKKKRGRLRPTMLALRKREGRRREKGEMITIGTAAKTAKKGEKRRVQATLSARRFYVPSKKKEKKKKEGKAWRIAQRLNGEQGQTDIVRSSSINRLKKGRKKGQDWALIVTIPAMKGKGEKKAKPGVVGDAS